MIKMKFGNKGRGKRRREKDAASFRQNQKFVKELRTNYQLYLLVLPCMLLMLLFRYVPMSGLIMAFQNYNITKGIMGSQFIGFANFNKMFHQEGFLLALRNTLVIKLLTMIIGLPLPIALAIMINEIGKKRYRKVMQTITYFPYFLSWVVINGILLNLLNVQDGVVNQIIKMLGGEPIAFMMSKKYFVAILILSTFWKNLGCDTIIYLAALTSIDSGLYEAAKIDGASKLQQIRHITLPGLMNTVIICQILAIGRILRANDEQILALYSEPVYEVADTIGTYVYRNGIGQMQYGYSTAVGLFQSVIGLIMVVFTNKLSQKYTENSVW